MRKRAGLGGSRGGRGMRAKDLGPADPRGVRGGEGGGSLGGPTDSSFFFLCFAIWLISTILLYSANKIVTC